MSQSASTLPLPPGNMGLPILGETLIFLQDPDYAIKKHQKYGSIFKTRLFGRPTICVKDALANQFVLAKEKERFAINWPASTQVLFGSLSLALQTGETHQTRRKILAQAFTSRALSGYIDTIEEITQHYCQKWQQIGQLTWYPEIRNYTLDIACKLLAGVDRGSQTELGNEFETWCKGLFTVTWNLPWTQFGQAVRSGKKLIAEVENIIRQRQQAADPGSDTLGLLLQFRDDEGNGLSFEELKNQLLLLLFAGHEALTSAIVSFCLETARHPEVEEKLRHEQKQFAPNAPLTLEMLKEMTYLEQVFQEVLRLIPPLGGGFRKILKTCEWGGYQLPEGWTLLFEIGQTQSNPETYADPNSFRPDRFTTPPDKYSYLPFGSGIRGCVGQELARIEMKIFAAYLLRGYRWQLEPGQDLSLATVPAPHPRDKLRVTFSAL